MSASMIEPPLFDGVIGSRDSVSGRFRKQVKMVSSVTESMSPRGRRPSAGWRGSAQAAAAPAQDQSGAVAGAPAGTAQMQFWACPVR